MIWDDMAVWKKIRLIIIGIIIWPLGLIWLAMYLIDYAKWGWASDYSKDVVNKAEQHKSNLEIQKLKLEIEALKNKQSNKTNNDKVINIEPEGD